METPLSCEVGMVGKHGRRPTSSRSLWKFTFLPCAALLLCVAARADDWPQFLGPDRGGISRETGLLSSWPSSGPPLLWQKAVGAGFSGPVVAGDALVFFHQVDDEEVVACLEASTGRQRWEFKYPTQYRDDYRVGEGPRSTPLVSGSRVYSLGAEGSLHCLELKTGRKVWQRSLNTEYQVAKGYFGVATSPIVEGSLLLINVGGKDAGIVAFDKDSGREVWKATNHEASYSSPVAAAFQGKRRVAFFTREGIVLLDPADGKIEYSKHWRARIQASVNAASPVVAGDNLFFSACYGTGAILLHVGANGVEEEWKSDDVMNNHYNTCIHHQGYLYGFDGRQEEGAKLRCIELKTGKVCWTCERSGCGSMLLAEGKLIVLTEEGDLMLVEATPEAYKQMARAAVLGKPCRSPIALSGGRLYARDGKKLMCWNLKK